MSKLDKDQFNNKLFEYLDSNNEIVNSREWVKSVNEQWDHQDAVGILKSWESLGTVVLTFVNATGLLLTEKGKQAVANGSPEALLWAACGVDGGLTPKEASDRFGPTAFGAARSKKWIDTDKVTKKLVQSATSITDATREILSDLTNRLKETKDINDMKKSGFVEEKNLNYCKINKGEKYGNRKKKQADLTLDMLKDDAWAQEEFKFNVNSKGLVPDSGFRHPLSKVKAEFKQIFLDMGFQEMPTMNYVENSFWNFDALFQPQQHPARDSHDTFFLSDPEKSHDFTDDHLEKVKTVHSKGGYGSIGYIYDWKLEEAEKNILRTHTTAVSARMLYKLAQTGFKPQKFFSIDRVFRNESLDATHLAEFHQVEGVIADKEISLSHLIAVISEFFRRLGIDNIRFKPAYNPYTEPSMEIFGYHPQLKRFVELGNSGIFRPEMLRPMGLPEDVRVAAWGLSLERPTMIKYEIDNIRSIFGNNINVNFIQNNPICMFKPLK
ncbi:phenylalanyl-tRNA synthetase [Tieghemostelium lacteum]|uniref:phenylalanine--tRNA ligase n=1 Tax=Tieghemostelium lacteum TaxID=361077 RepID=A0A151ZDS8_TIELA|nr:phenylalanyl-tRNA synthetase [Tieghemostelium lacteum]|eukprot:KYQ92085.1 phenylalanyl-tRNA synthetase [Tieghemostelium lacteum]